MHIRCPHCHFKVEVVNDDALVEVQCPGCDSRFSLVGEQGTTWTQLQTTRIAQFELLEQVGMGQFGCVWKARDTELDRTVAIKVPRKERLQSEDLEKFLREGRAAAQLKHPNIVSIHEIGRDGERLFLVSDFVQGCTLKEWLSAQRITIRESVQLCIKCAEALHHAHENGVVHRDFKPGNVMLDLEGEPHLTDFGLARRDSGEITVTADGCPLGTPAYMSPEQARGEAHQADRRTDVYSLGVVLYELLTGELPFRGDSRMLLVQILKEEPPTPRKLNSRIPRDLETICLKCLQKSADRRYGNAQEVAEDLSRWLTHQPILARPVGRMERAARWIRRQPVVAALIGLVVTVTIAGFAGVTWQLWKTQEANRLATEQKTRREKNYGRALKAVDSMLTQVGDKGLASSPSFAPRRKAILEDALALYEEILNEEAATPDMKQEVAAAAFRVGSINSLLGDEDAALKAYARSETLLRELLDAQPDNTQIRMNLCEILYRRGQALRTGGQPAEALKCFLAIGETLGAGRLIEKQARHTLHLATVEAANVELETGQLAAALVHASQGVSTAEEGKAANDPWFQMKDLPATDLLSRILTAMPDHLDEAQAATLDVIERYERHRRRGPVVNNYEFGISHIPDTEHVVPFADVLSYKCDQMAGLLNRVGRSGDAAVYSQRALDYRAEAIAAAEQKLASKVDTIVSLQIIAKVARAHARRLRDDRNRDEAIAAYQKSLDAYRQLSEQSPQTDYFHESALELAIELAGVMIQEPSTAADGAALLSTTRQQADQFYSTRVVSAESRQKLYQAILNVHAVTSESLTPALRLGLRKELLAAAVGWRTAVPASRAAAIAEGDCCHMLGDELNFGVRRPEEAKLMYEKARDIRESLLASTPDDKTLAAGLGWTSEHLANVRIQLDVFDNQTLQIANRGLELRGQQLKQDPKNSGVVNRLQSLLQSTAKCLAVGEQLSVEEVARSATLANAIIAIGNPAPVAWRVLGLSRYRQKNFAEAASAFKSAVDSQLPDAAIEKLYLGLSLRQLDQKEAGELSLRDGFKGIEGRHSQEPFSIRLREAIAKQGGVEASGIEVEALRVKAMELRDRKQLGDAAAVFATLIPMADALVSDLSPSTQSLYAAAWAHHSFGDFLSFSRHQPAEAILEYRRAFDLREKMIAKDGISRREAIDLGWTCQNLGTAMIRANQTSGLLAVALRAIELRRFIHDREPQDKNFTAWLNDAWILTGRALTRTGDLKSDDLKLAIGVATEAVATQPDLSVAWRVLGLARYRTGDDAEAIKALSRSSELSGKQATCDLFFLALAEHRSGVSKETARRHFDEGVELFTANGNGDPELKSLLESTRAALKGGP